MRTAGTTVIFRKALVSLAGVSAFVAPALAQFTIQGADRSDGAFSPIVSTSVVLSNASPGLWDAPSPVAGAGVYDREQWAVVFKYSSVTIPAGVTVSFANHSSRAPVVWLVDGPVTINGTLTLDGERALSGNESLRPSEPGPGGFRGAQRCSDRNTPGSSGFGPGGGINSAGCDSFGTGGAHATSYGSAQVLPLIGGSGGGRYFVPGADSRNGGAGGGAILVAATGTVTINGQIVANGGLGGNGSLGKNGAGGAIRLITPALVGGGALRAQRPNSFNGEDGRISIRANSQLVPTVQPLPETDLAPIGVFRAFPASADNPKSVRIVQVHSSAVASDPRAEPGFPQTDAILVREGSFVVQIVTRNMLAAATRVRVRVNPLGGASTTPEAMPGTVNGNETTWLTTVPFQRAVTSVLQATASNVVGPVTQRPLVFSREVSVYARFCLADFDDGTGTGTPDNGVTIEDLLYYLGRYAEGLSDADVDDGTGTGTPDGGVTIDDLLYYLLRFEAGC